MITWKMVSGFSSKTALFIADIAYIRTSKQQRQWSSGQESLGLGGEGGERQGGIGQDDTGESRAQERGEGSGK